MGRPAHAPEPFHRRQVEAMAGYGTPETDIARVLGIDPKTLRRYYREELDTGQPTPALRVLPGEIRVLGGVAQHFASVRPDFLGSHPESRHPPLAE